MKNVIFYVFTVLTGIYLFSGCVAPIAIGAVAGAGAVYDLTAGNITDNVDASKEVVVEKFINVVKSKNGTILFASISEGRVDAELPNRKVYLYVKNLTEKAVKFTVKGRKGYNMLPDKDVALEIYNEVIKELK